MSWLLDRFQLNAENDRAISEHVLRGHRFRKPGSDMEPEQLNGTSAEAAGQQEQTESAEEAAQVTCLARLCFPSLLVLPSHQYGRSVFGWGGVYGKIASVDGKYESSGLSFF